MTNMTTTAMSEDRRAPRMEEGVVARGRTILVPDPHKKTLAGYNQEGKPVQRAVFNEYGPGKTVNLPSEEIKSLRKLGFLIDPDAQEIEVGPGPNYTEAGSATKRA